MCDPASLTMLAISAVGAVVGHVEMQKSANAQQDALIEGQNLMNDQAQTQYAQINAQAADEMGARALQARQERARLRVVAGESGIGGNLLASAINQSYFNEGTDIATLESNRRNTAEQAYQEAQGARARTQSEINSIRRPSLIGTGLQIAGAGAQAYATSKTNELLASGRTPTSTTKRASNGGTWV